MAVISSAETSLSKRADFVAFDEMLGLSALDWFSKDSVGFKVVENEDVVHASAGNEGEPAGEIRGNNTCFFINGKDRGTDLVILIHVASRRRQRRFRLGFGLGRGADELSRTLHSSNDSWGRWQ